MSKQIIPEAALAQHIAVLGKTRSGKSSVMRGLVEGLLDREQPVCIIDPKGDWWGLKLSRDGKHPGYPIVIFGGEHADVPINAHAGAHVAELFATGNRPCLVDLGGWMVGERTRFWIDFASTLFRLTRGMRWLVVDEVHNFAPKGKILDPDAGKSLHWTNRLASEGLGKGLPMIFASQRPQKVHNDTLTSAETLIAMRVLHPSDRGAVADWIKGCGDLELGDKVLNSLAQMDRGEGWVWSPEIGFGPERVKFPMFKTYDSFRPQSVEDTKGLKGWAEVDLEDVKAKLATVVKEAEANDPKRLRARIAELERESKKSGAVAPVAVEKRIEVPAIAPEVAKRLEAVLPKLEKIAKEGAAIDAKLMEHGRHISEAWNTINEVCDATVKALQSVAAGRLPSRAPVLPFKPPARQASSSVSRQAVSGDSALPKGERVILTAIAQHPDGVTREQLTVLTGYKRSSRDTYIQRLREREFVAASGERLTATDAGAAALGSNFELLPTGDALREYWMRNLPEGERRVLEIVVQAYPDSIDRERISEATNYKRSSRDTYLQRLSARYLVVSEGRGQVLASEKLFG